MIFCICLSIPMQTETNKALNKCLHYLVIGSHDSGMFVQYYLYFKNGRIQWQHILAHMHYISLQIYRWSMHMWGEWEHLRGKLWGFMPNFSTFDFSTSCRDSALSTRHSLWHIHLRLQLHCWCDLPCRVWSSYNYTSNYNLNNYYNPSNYNSTRYEFNKIKFQVSNLTVIQSYYTYAGNT